MDVDSQLALLMRQDQAIKLITSIIQARNFGRAFWNGQGKDFCTRINCPHGRFTSSIILGGSQNKRLRVDLSCF